MTSQTKSANVQLYKIYYSRKIFKVEIIIVLTLFLSLIMMSDEVWFIPCFILYCLIAFIYFSKYSIKHQFSQQMTFEFRTAPDRLIWYDSAGESSFLLQDVKVRMTRWFVILKLVNSSKKWNGVLLQDSFVDMSHYTGFRRQLLLLNREDSDVS